VNLSDAARTVRQHCPLIARVVQVPGWGDLLQDGHSSPGRIVTTARQPAGVLVLLHGAAIVERSAPPPPPPGDAPPSGAFDFGGAPWPARVEAGDAGRWRISSGDHVPVPPADSAAPTVNLVTSSSCEWTFVPADPDGSGAPPPDQDGRNALARGLEDRAELARRDVVSKLTRFPALAGLSFDAVRYIASFLTVGRYGTGERVFSVGEEARPTLLLEGSIDGPDGTFHPGALLFPADLKVAPPFSPTIVAAEHVASRRTITASLPPGLALLLQDHDARASRRGDFRQRYPWLVAVGGGAEEVAPDAQTIALNQAAHEATDTGGALSSATPVLVIDADFESLERRAPPSMIAAIDHEPTWAGWSGPGQPFGPKVKAGIVGLDLARYPDRVAVLKLISAIDKWFTAQDEIKKILFRLPRNAGRHWGPVLHRAQRITVTTDDLLDPLPSLVPPLADVLRIARPIPGQPFRMAARVPYFTLPRELEPTRQFWSTGIPWLMTQG
jgi:hypothetical protein